MGTVTRAYSEVDGTVGEASSVNRVIDDLYTLVNGNLNSANIAAGGVGTTEIANGAVTPIKFDTVQLVLATQVFS